MNTVSSSSQPEVPAYPLDFAYAYGGPLGCAGFRTMPEDFVVEESLGFVPSGEGEHLLLHLRKCNQNTQWVAGQLAQLADISPQDVGYCGMKDRRAITSQWFSLYLPRREFDVTTIRSLDGVELLDSVRHNRKLRRGDHAANSFRITLRNCTAERPQLEARLAAIADCGVPNYFGEQRFGHNGGNLAAFVSRFVGVDGDTRAKARRGGTKKGGSKKGRQSNSLGGIYLSAGRSYLFNRILSARVDAGSWSTLLPGEEVPAGALWGRGRLSGSLELMAIEQQQVDNLPGWADALEHSGLSQERRPLVLLPINFRWCFKEDDLTVEFQLPPGGFATAVLRELTAMITPDTGHGIVSTKDITEGSG